MTRIKAIFVVNPQVHPLFLSVPFLHALILFVCLLFFFFFMFFQQVFDLNLLNSRLLQKWFNLFFFSDQSRSAGKTGIRQGVGLQLDVQINEST